MCAAANPRLAAAPAECLLCERNRLHSDSDNMWRLRGRQHDTAAAAAASASASCSGVAARASALVVRTSQQVAAAAAWTCGAGGGTLRRCGERRGVGAARGGGIGVRSPPMHRQFGSPGDVDCPITALSACLRGGRVWFPDRAFSVRWGGCARCTATPCAASLVYAFAPPLHRLPPLSP